MDIKHDIENLLAETGWDIPTLIAKTGANKDSIYRLMNGSRKGLGYKNIKKLHPYLYGDKRPSGPQEAA